MNPLRTRPATDAATLLNQEMRGILVANMLHKFPEMKAEFALRGVGQMLAFLAAGVHSPEPVSLSPMVDDFWHAFLLHTKAYREFCISRLGKFVDHQPGFLDKDEHGGGMALRARTVEVIIAAGYMVDLEFWPGLDIADCSQRHVNCHNSPQYNTAQTT